VRRSREGRAMLPVGSKEAWRAFLAEEWIGQLLGGGTAIAWPRRAHAAIHPSLSWISQISVLGQERSLHTASALARVCPLFHQLGHEVERSGACTRGARSRLMQRSKFRLEANSQFERRPHFCYELPLGRARAQRTHSEASGSGRHVDTARANRSADRREELVLALRIPFADLYGECFRLDTMPRARAGGIQRGAARRS